ncbi:MAG: hypothetical protein RL885_13740 [Planctomycetota bacterium]
MDLRVTLITIGLLTLIGWTPAPSTDDDPLDSATARAIAFLRSQQRDNGAIGDLETTPLTVLAAWRAGADLELPVWQKALELTAQHDSERTRELAWRILIFLERRSQVKDSKLRGWVDALVDLQYDQIIDLPPQRYRNAARQGEQPMPRFRYRTEDGYSDFGGWGEEEGRAANVLDTALAIRALLAAHEAGFQVDLGVFSRAFKFLTRHQSPKDGAWGHPTSGARGDATAAGAWALLTCSKVTGSGLDVAIAGGGSIRSRIDLAVKWLQHTEQPGVNPGAGRENVEGYRAWYRLLLETTRKTTPGFFEALEKRLIEGQLLDGSWRPGVARSKVDQIRATALSLEALPAWRAPDDRTAAAKAILEGLDLRTSEVDRLIAKERLSRLGDEIIEELILALRDERESVREVAVNTLRERTGQDFGYRSQDSISKNAEAFRQWSKWWLAIRSRRELRR